MIVDIKTNCIEIASNYIDENGFINISFNKDISYDDLRDLIKKHKNKNYSDVLYELIASHKHSDDKIFNLILDELGNCNWGIINSIITSGKASYDLLKRIEINYKDKHTQEHLELAYLKLELDKKLSLNKYNKILNKYLNDKDPENHAKRYTIACHSNTPKEILLKLAKDNHKHVVDVAKERLKNLIDPC